MSTSVIIKLVLSFLFIGCLFDFPYGYFQLVRTIGMVGFIWLFNIEDQKRTALKYFWIGSAILINPIVKIPLGRELWNIVDVVWVVLLLVSELANKES